MPAECYQKMWLKISFCTRGVFEVYFWLDKVKEIQRYIVISIVLVMKQETQADGKRQSLTL